MADEEFSGEGSSERGRVAEKCSVKLLEVYYKDADRYLKDESQAAYVEELCFERLPDFGDPSLTRDLRIRKFGIVWELETKGFVLHDICVGICFGHVEERHEVAVVGLVKKDYLGQPLEQYQQLKMTHRLTYYRSIAIG